MELRLAGLTFDPFITAADIAARVDTIARQLNIDYKDTVPVLIGVLNGSFLFFADLVKQLDIPCEITFIKLSSYHGGITSTMKIREDINLNVDIKGRDVLVIEDIVDTGNTAHFLLEKLRLKQPASLKMCSLLLKPAALLRPVDELKYVGFEIENEFVVGYGLDYQELGRNLKDIYKKM
ncbi:MAG: hypoxanthine phosphoribosyltransferase [Bacteroidota bacterium]